MRDTELGPIFPLNFSFSGEKQSGQRLPGLSQIQASRREEEEGGEEEGGSASNNRETVL